MRKSEKQIVGMAAAMMVAGMMSLTAWAATKTMHEVTVRVGANLTAGRTDEYINCDTWESLEPQGGIYAAVDSQKYSVRAAEWVNPNVRNVVIGGEPEMRLYLQMNDDDYSFASGLGARGVDMRGGTVLSAQKQGKDLEILVKLHLIKGRYAEPDALLWTQSGYGIGAAVWSFNEDNRNFTSGTYDVTLYRDSTPVKKLTEYQGSSYDFFPYMTKPGTYTFRIRTVPHTESEKRGGTRSEWVESTGISVGADQVSDGTGQGTWIQENGSWYFEDLSKTRRTNSWYMVNQKWYLFDAAGKMLTGWQERDNRTYYLDETGAMEKDWKQIDGKWYYFYPDGAKAYHTDIGQYHLDDDGAWSTGS
ncbi:MAG: hypothetical protein RSF83_09290 [Hungatella sp.]